MNSVACSNDEEDLNDHFQNQTFPACGGYQVFADYWYNRVFGNADGSLTGSWYTTVSGGANGCTNLLSQSHDLSYGT
jgi:hypothetical protein